MIDVVVCQTGMARHCPALREELGAQARVSTVECFDRCEVCERFVLARLDGAMMRFRDKAELAHAVRTLREG
ncbi:MAG: hypothetical protein ACOZNI_13480 [Myxococcota bacterium]